MSKRIYKYKIGDAIDAKIGVIHIDAIGIDEQNNRTVYTCSCDKGHHFKRYGYAMNSCPICSSRTIIQGLNDMSITNPSLYSMLVNKDFGLSHAQKSNKKTDWICPDCGNIVKDISPNQVLRYGLGCKICSDGVSYGEKYIGNLLKINNVTFIKEYGKKQALWCGKYRYDFYLPKYDCIIEVQGLQHYVDSEWNSYRNILENDNSKKELALQFVKYYIEIDAKKSNKDYLKKSILYSDLVYIIDPLYIKWNEIHKDSLKSNVKLASDMFNNGKNIIEISKILNVHKGTIRNYLKSASQCDLCNYNPCDESNRTHQDFVYRNTQNKSKPIICNENGCVFSNSLKCQNESLNIFGVRLDASNIRMVLYGKRNHTGNFTFSYINRKQFNSIKSKSPECAYGDFFILT